MKWQKASDWDSFWEAWYDLPTYMAEHESRIDEEDIVDEDGSPDYAQFTWDEVQQFRDYLDTLDRKFQEIEDNL